MTTKSTMRMIFELIAFHYFCIFQLLIFLLYEEDGTSFFQKSLAFEIKNILKLTIAVQTLGLIDCSFDPIFMSN